MKTTARTRPEPTGNLVDTGSQIRCHFVAQPTRLSRPTAETGSYHKGQWKEAPPGHRYVTGSRNANALLAGASTDSGDHRGSKFLWVSCRKIYSGCGGTMLYGTRP